MTETANISAAAPRPAHITDAVFYDFDMFYDPAYIADPHKRVMDLLENAPPVFWTPRNGGHWMLVSHAANFEAARDTETFSSEVIPHAQIEAILSKLPPDSPPIPRAYPINLDPPLHAQYRQPVQGVFSPKAINNL